MTINFFCYMYNMQRTCYLIQIVIHYERIHCTNATVFFLCRRCYCCYMLPMLFVIQLIIMLIFSFFFFLIFSFFSSSLTRMYNNCSQAFGTKACQDFDEKIWPYKHSKLFESVISLQNIIKIHFFFLSMLLFGLLNII